MTAPSQSDREYAERLGEVLSLRDPEALRQFLVESARRFGDERQVAEVTQQPEAVVEMMMHRMTVSRPDLAPLHAESHAWLVAHGFEAPPRPPGQRPGLRRPSSPSTQPRQPKRR